MSVPKHCLPLIMAALLATILLPLQPAYADYTLPDTHPRVLITPEELAAVVDRMSGSGARPPYAAWFGRIREREAAAQTSAGMTPDLLSLALLYHGTSDPADQQTWRDWYTAALATYMNGRAAARRSDPESRCGPSFDALISMDLMWPHIPEAVKLDTFAAASGINAFYWHSGVNADAQNFDYHGAAGRAPAFAFAALFDGDAILSHPDVAADPQTYAFNTSLYIETIQEELSPTGQFWRMENRIAGDPTDNSALPGDFGGMYDNIGYDTGEESWSIFLVTAVSTALGEDRLTGFLHDRWRGRFYQNLEIPYTGVAHGSGENAYTEHRFEVVWNTQTDWMTSPSRNALALTATKYQDPHMQYYADRWRKTLNVYNYDYYITDIPWMLLFFDDALESAPPSANPTARYFSGPGLVGMRENWSDNAAFAVFMAGEGISRRYEDANSFVLSRKGPIVVHAGARIRNNADNTAHHWFHIRSISKNTLKIFDPLESFDVDAGGRITALHTGTRLVASDNMGGQLFETGISGENGVYVPGYGGALDYRRNSAFELGVWNTADIVKYEHVPDAYTYAVGDGTEAYTRKIDRFEREFVYLRPDVFVLFDRVRSVDAAFEKAWTIHTVDEPRAQRTPDARAQGERQYANAHRLTLENSRNTTILHTLLPRENRVTVRGGDTELASGLPLRNGTPIQGAQIQVLDVPRWLELFAVGADTVGDITIYGDAREGNGVSETIAFNGSADGTLQTYQDTTGFYENDIQVVLFEGNRMTHQSRSWQADCWAGYMLRLHGGAGGLYVITANSADHLVLTEAVDAGGAWAYSIVRPLANTYMHWQRIARITTTDMDISHLTVSVPHYFDARGADGTVYSFAPHTDSRDDGYRKKKALGQWSVETVPTRTQNLTNFLNLFIVGDPGMDAPAVQTIETSEVSGAMLDNRLVLFANQPVGPASLSFDCPYQGEVEALVMDLAPATTYYTRVEGGRVQIADAPNQGVAQTTTTMGVLHITFTANGTPDPPTPDNEPDGGSGGGGGCFVDLLIHNGQKQ